jgi:hypothetical protein
MSLRRRCRTAAEAYAVAVGHELRDVPSPRRRRLVDGLRQHLAELPDGADLDALLGPPRSYAEELRSSTGIPPVRGLARLRRVRLRWWIGGGLVAAVLAVGCAAGVWLLQYQPLAIGGSSFVPGQAADSIYGGNGNVVVDYQDQAQYELEFSVANRGPVDVEVTSIPLRQFIAGPLLLDEVRLDPPNTYGGDSVPFHPFTLHAGEERGITLRGVLTHCNLGDAGGAEALESLDLHYRVFGLTKTQTISLHNPAAVRFPGPHTAQCPLGREPSGIPNGVGTDRLFVLHSHGSVMVQVVAPITGRDQLARVGWPIPPACPGASVPSGERAVAVDIVVNEDIGEPDDVPSALPIDMRFSVAGGGAVLLAGTCSASRPLHIDSIDDGGIVVTHGAAFVPSAACGRQLIDVQAGDGGHYQSAGQVSTDVACPVPHG